MALLTLLCVNNGERATDSFPIRISADGTIEQLQRLISARGAVAGEITLWRVSSIPAASDELIHLNSIQNREQLFPEETLSEVFGGRTQKDTIDIVIQSSPVEVRNPTFRLQFVFSKIVSRNFWTTNIQRATLWDLKRNALPGNIERPPDDAALRIILEKYSSNNIFDLIIDLETPNKKYSDYTEFDGYRRYGSPLAFSFPATSTLLRRSAWEAALQRLYDEVESRLKQEQVEVVSCFFVQACALFPALDLEFNKPMMSNLGQGTVDIAIKPAGDAGIVGFVSIDKDIKTARARNMVQLESAVDIQADLPEGSRKRKRSDTESNTITTTKCGFVTNRYHWQSIHYSLASDAQKLPTFYASEFPCIFQCMESEDLHKNIEAIFTRIVHLMSELAEGLPDKHHKDNKRKRRH